MGGFYIPGAVDAAWPLQSEIFELDTRILSGAIGGTRVAAGCGVTPAGTPDMTVDVAAGVIRHSSSARITVSADTLTVGDADPTDFRLDLVSASALGVATITSGTPAGLAAVKPPDLPSGHVPLAVITVAPTALEISAGDIIDKRLFADHDDVVYATGFGATGDDSTDDTAALQAAIDATPVGGVCHFPVPPGGAYKITDELAVPHTMILRGAASFIGTYTKLRQATANTSALRGPTGASQHWTLDGLQITGAIGAGETSSAAILSTQSISVRNCRTQGFYDGLWLVTDGTANQAVYYSTAENSFFDSAQRAGVLLGGDVNNFTWRDCRAASNAYGVNIVGGPMSARFYGGAIELNTVGFAVDGVSATPQNTAGVLVHGVYFEQADGAIDINIGATSLVYGVTIDTCTFVKSAFSGSGWHVNAAYVNGLVIINNEWMSSQAVNVTSPATNVIYGPNHNRNGGTVNLPANTLRLDPSSFVTPQPTGVAGDAGTSPYPARADHIHEDASAGGATDLGELTDVSITGEIAGEHLRWNGSQWINDAGMICVDPGTLTIDAGDPFGLTLETVWGIDAGIPYYDDAGAAEGEEAALFFDPLRDIYVLVAYAF